MYETDSLIGERHGKLALAALKSMRSSFGNSISAVDLTEALDDKFSNKQTNKQTR
jgi:hypothetical protein